MIISFQSSFFEDDLRSIHENKNKGKACSSLTFTGVTGIIHKNLTSMEAFFPVTLSQN